MRVLASILIVLTASAFGGGAAAEDAPAGSADEASRGTAAATADAPASTPPRRNIEEIVIQAGESDASADFEAGDSVAAFDASDLQALGAQSIADLAAFTPNLEIVTSGATTPTFFIRGVGLNDFNSNSSGAVAIYQNDVPMNSPALQLGTLFDIEAVNILRGPQGIGPYRNASAGAIKVYARKPSGDFGGFLTQSYGNYDLMDYEGAVETPIYEDILSARFAFRLTKRDGWMRNGCGNAEPVAGRAESTLASGTTEPFEIVNGKPGKPLSLCGERVAGTFFEPKVSPIEEDLPSWVNDTNNWSARGTLLFQPTLDMEWLLTAQGSRRDEHSRVGQAYGSRATEGLFDPECLATLSGQIYIPFVNAKCKSNKVLGGEDRGRYQAPEVKRRLNELDPCKNLDGTFNGSCDGATTSERRTNQFRGRNSAALAVAEELVDLDSEPWRGDFNRVGNTVNDVWGVSLKGDVVLGDSVFMTSVSGYNTYDRRIDIDLDFTPNQLFQFITTDDGWQFTQDLSFAGDGPENVPIRWEIGGFYLAEVLNVRVGNFFDEQIAPAAVSAREYTQTLHSAAGYASLEWDFWQDFTLDGGFRWNWEYKDIDYLLFPALGADVENGIPSLETNIWQAPTGTVRLTYRFREDTHAYWKYTRGFKGGHYNATGSKRSLVGTAEPESIDAFEAGLRGSWFGGRLGLQGSIFHYNYENYQIFTAIQLLGAPPEFVVLNAAKAEVYGAEMDIGAGWRASSSTSCSSSKSGTRPRARSLIARFRTPATRCSTHRITRSASRPSRRSRWGNTVPSLRAGTAPGPTTSTTMRPTAWACPPKTEKPSCRRIASGSGPTGFTTCGSATGRPPGTSKWRVGCGI